MSKYRIDGVVVDTDLARRSWDEDSYHDGRNWISKNTGSQWEHEGLYQSRKGRYYIVEWNQWQGTLPSARFVSSCEAAEWLAFNGHELPADLAEYADDVVE